MAGSPDAPLGACTAQPCALPRRLRPGSEPETKALLAYLKQGFAAVLSLHSRAGILDCNGPGGAALAKRMAALCRLPVGHLGYQPYITGSLGDYVPAKYGIPIITVE